MIKRSIALVLLLACQPAAPEGADVRVIQPLPVPSAEAPLVTATTDGRHHTVQIAPGALRVLPRPTITVGRGPLSYWTDLEGKPRLWMADTDLGPWVRILHLETDGESAIGGTIRYEYPLR